MTLPVLPRLWATDDNFSSGPSSGQPTKVDPGAGVAAQGFVPGTPVAAAHWNHLINQSTRAQRRLLEVAALKLRLHANSTATPPNNAGIAVCSTNLGAGGYIVAAKAGTTGVQAISDQAAGIAGTSLPSPALLVAHDAARNPSTGRIVIVGEPDDEGTGCAYSTGITGWTAGGDTGGTYRRIAWNAAKSIFVASGDNNNVIASSNGESWDTHNTIVDADDDGGVAVLANGHTIVVRDEANLEFLIQDDSPPTGWVVSEGAPANADTFDDGGCVVGNNGPVVWHVGRRNSGATLRISSSGDGHSWSTLADLTPPASGITFNARPRLMCCQDTGLLVVIAPATSGKLAWCSLDAGVTWSSSFFLPDCSIDGFGVAGGRLIATLEEFVMTSDGIGWS